MNIDTKLREGSAAINELTRKTTFTSRTPRANTAFTGSTGAWIGALVVLVLIGLPVWLLAPSQTPSVPVGSAGSLGVIGGEGPSFVIDDPAWRLAQASITPDDAGGSFILYESADKQVFVATGWPVEEMLINAQETGVKAVATSNSRVQRYDWAEGVSYVWRTSSGTPVAVVFGQMSLTEAENSVGILKEVDAATFHRLVASAPSVPTTLGRTADD